MFKEEKEAALWADYQNIIIENNNKKRNFPDMSAEQLNETAMELVKKYGETMNEKHSRTRQGNLDCKKKTTPYRGVSKQGNKYVAQICLNGNKEIICRTYDLKEAAEAYNKRALELFGKYAKLNELD